MKLSKVIEFLEFVKDTDGDIKLESITGFWIRDIPSTGERIVVASVGDGLSVADLIKKEG